MTEPKSGHKRFPFNNFTYCLTLFSKCFSSFDHSTCALSVSGRYLALEDIYLPFRAAFPNYSTRRRSFTEARCPTRRGSHPLWRPVPGNSEGTSPKASSANYNSGRGPDFKFELLPLHSPLLGQSLLVSFPPLIDMLKFSGYSYLIRGQPFRSRGGFTAWPRRAPVRGVATTQGRLRRDRHSISGPASDGRSPAPSPGGSRVEMTLGQACPPEYWRAQCAFKDSMIHWILQFTLLIAFRCVLHRCQSQEIRC